MFLLSKPMLIHHMNDGDVAIKDFKEENLHHTYYYFRLGMNYLKWDESSKSFVRSDNTTGVVVVPPRGYVVIESFEHFSLNEKVFASLSQISDVPLSGLRLNHSSTIDPYFAGRLELGIENLLDAEVSLKIGENIGKIVFFNISDSRPIPLPNETISKEKYSRREAQEVLEPGKLMWA